MGNAKSPEVGYDGTPTRKMQKLERPGAESASGPRRTREHMEPIRLGEPAQTVEIEPLFTDEVATDEVAPIRPSEQEMRRLENDEMRRLEEPLSPHSISHGFTRVELDDETPAIGRTPTRRGED